MRQRQNNQLPDNIPQLQNLIKRDPQSYHDEFMQQYDNFNTTIEMLELLPSENNKQLEQLVMFLSQVAHCYTTDLSTYPQQLIDILRKYCTMLHPNIRMSLCKALILLRNKNLLLPTDLLSLFFELLRCQDKTLRDFLQTHIITDIKNINAKHKNAKLNTHLQNFMFQMLKDSNSKAAKMSADIMIELYRKNIWNDTKTVNVIATGCFSNVAKVQVACITFFLGKDREDEQNNSDSDSDADIDVRSVALANRVNKKSKKREKQLNKVKKLASIAYKKKSRAPAFNFSAIHLIHDPQEMAEKLFRQLDTTTKRFPVKILILDLISRLIGLHQLFLFNFYPYIQRFFAPHQREVTRILQFGAQAAHDLVPPDVLEPVLRGIANNFITERNSNDAMAIGLNAVREICARCPLSMSEELLRDLVQYKNYKDRSVMMAARSLIQSFRVTRPALLHRKDRGRPTMYSSNLDQLEYGKIHAKDYVEGAEVLAEDNKNMHISSDASDSDDGEWINIEDSTVSNEVNDVESSTKIDKSELAQKITLERLLDDDDFKRINTANAQKQVQNAPKGIKRKRTNDDADIGPSKTGELPDLVKLSDIENIYKKRKHDKSTRVQSVKSGQKDREKFGFKDGRLNEYCSKTNREKQKKKHYQMIRHKLVRKTKRSFKEKQIALRNHLINIKKMK